MSLVSSPSAMPAVHLPGLRPVTPTEGPPAPTSMLMPTAWSRLSTTSLMTSTDSVSRAPTFPLLALPALSPPSSRESRPLPPSSRESRLLTPRRSSPLRLLSPRLTPPRRLPLPLPLPRGRGVPPRLLLPDSPFPTPTASLPHTPTALSPLWLPPPLPPSLPTLPMPPLRSSPPLPLPTLPVPSPLLLLPPPGRPPSPPSSSTPATPSSTVWTKLCFERLYLHFPIHPASQTILVP